MQYYHVAIRQKNEKRPTFFFNLEHDQVGKEIIVPIANQKQIMCKGHVIQPLEIVSFRISETKERAYQVLKNAKKKKSRIGKAATFIAEKDPNLCYNEWTVMDSGKDVTSMLKKEFIPTSQGESIGEVKKEQETQETKQMYKTASPSQPSSEGLNTMEWEKLREKIILLQGDIAPFKVEFLDRDAFKKFCDCLYSNLNGLKEICMSGYFSETVRAELEKLIHNDYHHVRLISPEFPINTSRDKKNLEALKKLSEAGAKVKFNNRLHARLLVAYTNVTGVLILGSFDFNADCIGQERYDVGIKTSHPDLVKSAIDFFELVWNDSGTTTIEKFSGD